MKQPSVRLIHALIAKSIVETLLLGVLTTGFWYVTFPPIRGDAEAVSDGIQGWAVDQARPWARLEVQLFVDRRFVGSGVANISRPDVVKAGFSEDDWHGYLFPLSSLSLAPGIHEASVYAMHESAFGVRRSLQRIGDPVDFSIDHQGRLTSANGGRGSTR